MSAPSVRPRCPSRRARAPLWHTHPGGQTLIVTAGHGWVQEWGGNKERIAEGDVIWIPPGVKHWHGATDDTAMTHIAIQAVVGGRPVEWLAHVADDQYLDEKSTSGTASGQARRTRGQGSDDRRARLLQRHDIAPECVEKR